MKIIIKGALTLYPPIQKKWAMVGVFTIFQGQQKRQYPWKIPLSFPASASTPLMELTIITIDCCLFGTCVIWDKNHILIRLHCCPLWSMARRLCVFLAVWAAWASCEWTTPGLVTRTRAYLRFVFWITTRTDAHLRFVFRIITTPNPDLSVKPKENKLRRCNSRVLTLGGSTQFENGTDPIRGLCWEMLLHPNMIFFDNFD